MWGQVVRGRLRWGKVDFRGFTWVVFGLKGRRALGLGTRYTRPQEAGKGQVYLRIREERRINRWVSEKMEPFRSEGKARCTGHLASYVMVRVMWVDGAGFGCPSTPVFLLGVI